jgi:hypothetical protein
MKFKQIWDYIQSLFDIDGDMIMAIFTLAIVWKIVHPGLNMADATAYGSAIAVFGYSNTHKGS